MSSSISALSTCMGSSYGGLEHEFIGDVPEDLLCGICTKVLNIPHLTDCCGQHYCTSCLNHWLSTSTHSCPFCRNSEFNHMHDKNFSRRVNELTVTCSHSMHGCNWTGSLKDLKHHVEDSVKGCGYQIVDCPLQCGEHCLRNNINNHIKLECKHREVHCEHCGNSSKQYLIDEHMTVCKQLKVPCPKKCNQIIKRSDIEFHLNEECINENIQCLFHHLGCKICVRREFYEEHVRECKEKYLAKSHENIIFEMKSLKEEILSLRTENSVLKYELTSVKAGLKGISDNTEILKNENAQLKSVLQSELSFLHAPLKPCEALSLNCMKTHLKGQFIHLNPGGDTATFRFTDYCAHKQSGRVWYSPSFYFNRGYRLCLAIHLNGVGAGKGTHVALYLHQLVGQFDSALTWPFSLKEDLEIRIMKQEQAKESKLSSFFRGTTDKSSPTTYCTRNSLASNQQGSINGNSMIGYPMDDSRLRTPSSRGSVLSSPSASNENPSGSRFPGIQRSPWSKISPRLSRKMVIDPCDYCDVAEYQIMSISQVLHKPIAIDSTTCVSHILSKLELFCLQNTVANAVFLDSLVLQCKFIADHGNDPPIPIDLADITWTTPDLNLK